MIPTQERFIYLAFCKATITYHIFIASGSVVYATIVGMRRIFIFVIAVTLVSNFIQWMPHSSVDTIVGSIGINTAMAASDSGALVTCTNPEDCNWCTFIQMFDRALDFLFKFLTLAAVMMVMYAGFQLVISQGNSGAMEKAKGFISNIIIGFVIMMSAWLIIDTVIKGLVDTEAGYGQWNELKKC